MKFSDILFKEVKELWEGYLEHPFVKEIGEGTLEKDKFKKYLIQDYLYLKEYTKVFAMGLVKARNRDEMNLYYQSIKGILEDESQVHTNYLRDFGLASKDIEEYKPNLTTTSYTSYMLGIGLKGDLKEIAMTILPCTWSYYYIGKNLYERYKKNLEGNFYKPWIEEYSCDEFKNCADTWIDYINSICKDIPEEEVNNLKEIFVKSSLYEMEFWNMAYN